MVDINSITEKIIGCCIKVHKSLRPGLLESTYEECLFFELQQAGLRVDRQKELPIQYKSIELRCGYRIDLLVEDQVIIELKSVDQIIPIHEAQILTYLKLSHKKVGLLINFNSRLLMKGLHRFVNNLEE